MKGYAPVVVYTYSRIDHLKKTIAALQANHLARDTDIFVVSDGPKDDTVRGDINKLREYVDSIDGFKSVNRIYRKYNVGLVQSIVMAERVILADYDRLITMEDDIVTARNYLDFINAGLDFYEYSDNVFSVAGYTPSIKLSLNYGFDSFNCPWPTPWGFGTWKKKNYLIDFGFNPLDKIQAIKHKYDFLKKHGDYFIDTLKADACGNVDAADARVAGQMLLMGLYTVMPSRSKVKNIGFDGSGIHCGISNRYDVDLDDGQQRVFKFSADGVDLNNHALKEFLRFHNGTQLNRLQKQLDKNIGNVKGTLRKIEFLRMLKGRMDGYF